MNESVNETMKPSQVRSPIERMKKVLMKKCKKEVDTKTSNKKNFLK